jgi:hypothetical protein
MFTKGNEISPIQHLPAHPREGGGDYEVGGDFSAVVSAADNPSEGFEEQHV